MSSMPPASGMQQYRQRLRAARLRPIQLWVPDTKVPRFAAECRRQSAALAYDAAELNAAKFIEAAGAWNE